MTNEELTREEVMQSALRGVGADWNDSFKELNAQLHQLEAAGRAQTEAVQANATAAHPNAMQGGQASIGGANTLSAAQNTFALGLGLSPWITGLLSLFGGGGEESRVAPLEKFVLPEPVNLNAELHEGRTTRDGYSGGTPQITVQVQAMDSRSFLDHSQDIAAAVRQAMLESSVLNDAIREV